MIVTSNSAMTQTLGYFQEEIPGSQEYLTISFSPSSVPRRQRWSNYGLSADFLGDYFATFFPGDQISDSKINRKETVKAAVSYIANELMENAVKYSDEAAGLPISITLYLYEQAIIFKVSNYANQATVEKYQTYIQEILNADIDDLYTRQLENVALGNGISNMGLLTMINDYSANFGWKFQTLEARAGIVRVTVMATLGI